MKKFLIYIALLSPAWAFAQDTIPEIEDKDFPFDLFIKDLEDRFEVKIFYMGEWVASIEDLPPIRGSSLEEVLTFALEGTDLGYLKYSVSNYVIAPSKDLSEVLSLSYVLVKERFNTSEILTNVPMLYIGDSSLVGQSSDSHIRLKILDFKNEEPVAGAALYIETLGITRVSSSTGLIEVTVPSGVHLTEIRMVGYVPLIGNLSVFSDGTLDIYLDQEIIELEEVIITGEGAQKNILGPSAGMVTITPRQIKELPVFLGESDLIKAILILPGVSTLGEGTSGYYVRGGNIDQNLILQDGALFFNSSHALGFFSVFNPDLINRVTLYKGHIPAQYGGRLSSVLKIDLKGSVAENFILSGGIGTVMSKLALETPVLKGKSSLLLGGRMTYSDYILRMIKIPEIRESSASFYDFNFRYNHKVGQNGTAFLSYYQSGDEVQYERLFGFNWNINNVSLGWNQPLNEFLFSELTISAGKNRNESFDPSQAQSYLVQSGQKYVKAKQNIIATWDKHETIAGIEWTNFNPEEEILYGATGEEQQRITRNGGHEFGLYLNDDWEISDLLSVSAGLRWSAFLEKDSISSENAYFKNLEPRLSIRVKTSVTSSVKASYNRINQYLHLVTNTSSPLPTDQWLAASENLLPKQADNFSIGYYKNFEFNQWESSAELFFRKIRNLAEIRSFANLILNPAIEEDVVQGDGRTYGLELYLKKNSGRLKGTFSYTFSRALLYVALESDKEPEWISSAIDRPHNLNFNLDYTFSKKAKFALNFVYSSGRPITAPTSTYLLGKVVVPHYSERNQFRIPDYHRLDIAYTVKRNAIRRKRYQDSITFSIYNLYGRRNAFSVFFRKDENSRASAYRLSILGSAFPSITYNFKF